MSWRALDVEIRAALRRIQEALWELPDFLQAAVLTFPAGDGRVLDGEAIAQVLTACRNTGKIPGFAAFTPQEAKKRAEQGFLFLTAGTDFLFMEEGVRSGVTYLYGERTSQGNADGN